MSKTRVTATLDHWLFDNTMSVMWGNIKGDVHGRWPDGTWVRTSYIPNSKGIEFRTGDLVTTLNSVYKLGIRDADD